MKRFGAACALALAVIGWSAGCNDYGNTFQSPTGASLSSISPSNASAGSATFTLNVFFVRSTVVAKTVVQWNGKTIPTTVTLDANGNVQTITATVDASLIATPGVAAVNTLNPHSGSTDNGLSNTLNFVINPPPNKLPTLTSMTPDAIGAGSKNVSLTLTGQDFLPTAGTCPGTLPPISTQSEVNWNANGTQTALTTFASISASQIQLVLPDSLLVSQGTALVTVRNPPACPPQKQTGISNPFNGGGGTSANNLTFTINGDPPTNNAAPTSALAVADETPALGSDGRFVAYTATQNGHSQIFLRDTCAGASTDCQPHTALLSAAADGTAGNADSNTPSMSADGRFVAFSSAATNLAANTPAGRQIFLYDTCAGATTSCTPQTTIASTDESGALSGNDNLLPSLSSSGRFVAFLSVTPSKYPAKTGTPNSGVRQIFVRDTCLGATSSCTPKTTRLSVMPGDTNSQPGKPAGPAISSSAQAVGISSAATPTLLTRSVAVDDRVFLALTGSAQK
jgi:Periplasmic component of the Tol biopolymer transport system